MMMWNGLGKKCKYLSLVDGVVVRSMVAATVRRALHRRESWYGRRPWRAVVPATMAKDCLRHSPRVHELACRRGKRRRGRSTDRRRATAAARTCSARRSPSSRRPVSRSLDRSGRRSRRTWCRGRHIARRNSSRRPCCSGRLCRTCEMSTGHTYQQFRGCQTIDKVGQLLRAWFSCQRKSADEIVEPWHTPLLTRRDSDDKKWQTMRTPTLLCCCIFWLRNNIKSGPYGSAVCYSTDK